MDNGNFRDNKTEQYYEDRKFSAILSYFFYYLLRIYLYFLLPFTYLSLINFLLIIIFANLILTITLIY